jgi:hypothetical protein
MKTLITLSAALALWAGAVWVEKQHPPRSPVFCGSTDC